MNDEKFELTISDLAGSGTYYADIADELRARDTAQRDSIAKLETELKYERQIQGAMAAGQKAVADALGIPPGEYSGGAGEQLLAIEKIAALATQAAAGEPIGWLRLEPDDNETASYHFYRQAVEGSAPVCFVTATPAAAPVAGSEPVAWVMWVDGVVVDVTLKRHVAELWMKGCDVQPLVVSPSPAAAHGYWAVRKPELAGYFSFCEDKQKWLQQKSKGAEFNHLFTPLYAMRAQAEQQEAPKREVTFRDLLNIPTSQLPREDEAQGAQVGDEEWEQFVQFLLSETPAEHREHTRAAIDQDRKLEMFNEYRQGAWDAWKARAALATLPAAGEPTKLAERGRVEFERECRKQHRDITRNDVPGFEWGYLNQLTHDRWCGFHMAVRCMRLEAAAHGDEAVLKDAERYRWFRDNCQGGDLVIAKSDGFSLRSWSGDDPDRHIDAAMRAQGDGAPS